MRPTAQCAKPAIDTVTLAVPLGNAGVALSPANSRGAERGLGVYIHFPWCFVKCPYCDFTAFRKTLGRIEHERYADAVVTELDVRKASMGAPATLPVRSVFFGGGTPSLWRAAELGRVLKRVLEVFGAAGTSDFATAPSNVEVTVECDPTHLDEGTVQALADQGVGRVSIGVQAFHDERLLFLGRAHRADQARAAITTAVRCGIPHVAVDLLFGVPGLAPETAAAESLHAVELGATHVSAYSLTIEPNTVFGRLARQGRLPIVEDAIAADSFLAVHDALTRAGLEHYEISNYARAGHRSVHNTGYWIGDDYLGLGCGAVGTLSTEEGTVRYRNEPHPQRYLDRAALLGSAPADHSLLEALATDHETLTPCTRLRERIMLGLRMAEGFDLTQAGRDCGLDPWTTERLRALEVLVSRGRIACEGSRLKIPPNAWVWTDGTATALF